MTWAQVDFLDVPAVEKRVDVHADFRSGECINIPLQFFASAVTDDPVNRNDIFRICGIQGVFYFLDRLIKIAPRTGQEG